MVNLRSILLCERNERSMCSMKKSLLILLIVFAIIIAIYIFVISGAFSLFMSAPEKPEITYGEFPFTITYEVNGEMKKVEDAVVCEYDGIKNLGTAGKYRTWKSKLKSGNERVTLLSIEEENRICEITVSPGLPEYYMGDFIQDKTEYEKNMLDDRYLGYIEWKDGKQTGNTIPKEEVYEKYKLKVIEMDFSEPVENKFEQ